MVLPRWGKEKIIFKIFPQTRVHMLLLRSKENYLILFGYRHFAPMGQRVIVNYLHQPESQILNLEFGIT